MLTSRGLGTVLGDLAAMGFDARWELATPARLTSGSGSGYWPTPKKSQDGNSPKTLQMVRDGTAEASLNRVIHMPDKWPTPTASVGGPEPEGKTKRKLVTQAGGSLNPTWVEWLMGWPLAWTDLKPLETGKFRQWQLSHGKS